MGLRHKFVSSQPPSSNPALVGRTEWNDEHAGSWNVIRNFGGYTVLAADFGAIGLMVVITSGVVSSVVLPSIATILDGTIVTVKFHDTGAGTFGVDADAADMIYDIAAGGQVASLTLTGDGAYVTLVANAGATPPLWERVSG